MHRLKLSALLVPLGAIFVLDISTSTAFCDEKTVPGLRVPPGFEVTEFADSTLANDIFCMTVDPKGRVVVSSRGYIRLLLDEKGDGRATRALDFAGAPKDGAMGLFWEGDNLYCMGDGGLKRYRDAGGAGRMKPPELLAKFTTGGEHAAHAIRRGPDGWLYVLCGNNTGISKANATLPTSPVRDPIAGAVLRFSPDFSGCEIVADGFRNAYGFDFNCDGELFTFDSDNERCVSLPWYESTRLYHVVPGAHFGWQAPQRAQSWRYPPHFLDVTAPVATFGRGSPTGVVCYRHVQFPEAYRGGLFLLDWTFGRIYFVKLERSGASFTAKSEVFLEATGENGFAPTAAAVHPVTGDLFVSIGGRGTRGAVYRIRYPKGLASIKAEDVAKLQPPPRSLEFVKGAQKEWVSRATGTDRPVRLQAMAQIRRHPSQFDASQIEEAIRASWNDADRSLRQAAARLLGDLERKDRDRIIALAKQPREQTTAFLARAGFGGPGTVDTLVKLIGDGNLDNGIRLDAVRLLQREVGDIMSPTVKGTVWEGYTRRRKGGSLIRRQKEVVRTSISAKAGNLNRELARLLALVEDDDEDALERVARQLTTTSHPTDDVHYLIVLARLKGKRSATVTKHVAAALLQLDHKIVARKLNRDSNWPLRLGELYVELARKDPALNAALLASSEFGRADHALFAQAEGFDRVHAAEKFLERSRRDEEFAWNPDLIRLLGELPDDKALPVLRQLWGEHGLDDVILPLLARKPDERDRARFLDGLGSARIDTVRVSLDPLEKLKVRKEKDEVLKLILALRRLPPDKQQDALRERLANHLRKVTGEKWTTGDAWATWFVKQHPELAARLGDADGVDVVAWNKRLAGIDWSGGDAARGKGVFVKASCAACHSGTQALGPDLNGIAGRFSRADVFTAILQPSKDVSPRYRTTLIATSDGKSYQGLIVYEAVDSIILQTGPAATIRLTNKQIVDKRQTTRSLMPAGLIDRLTDREIVDLYAYLRSLNAGTTKP
jgi:putative heme-binding domain-containing protein